MARQPKQVHIFLFRQNEKGYEYAFFQRADMPYYGQVKLSEEHSDMKWLTYDEAYDLIYYNDQKIALYELNEKLLRNIIAV